MAENKNLRPLLKYPGGKERELNHINDALPSIINNYYEPFLGGGAVYFNINAKHYYVNDKSKELMDFLLLQCGIGNGKIILLKSSSTNGPVC